jgi:epoxyqueuosine reductase
VKLSSKSSDAAPAAGERTAIDFTALAALIKRWGSELGFQRVGITATDLSQDEARLLDWLDKGYHGEMAYMQQHGRKRSRPQELLPGTVRIISVRMDYWPPQAAAADTQLNDPARAYVARYALGRDYHKLGGSWFFLGELFTDLPLPVDPPASAHCGTCQACIDICPTGAIVAPYQLDARRCISYLTIELRGPIPESLRPLLGNRIYGCDDCQLVCPWNRFARPSGEADFLPRHALDNATLVELFRWTEAEFLARTEGTAIRRIGHISWLRNVAVALGNGPRSAEAVAALTARRDHTSSLVREHVDWALRQLAGESLR